MRRTRVFFTALSALVFLALMRAPSSTHAVVPANPCAQALPVPGALRLPRTVPPGEPIAVEQQMLAYLKTYEYRDLGWCVDKRVRDTGPFIAHTSFGTHPTVRVYYSPEMMAWLRGGRHGVPADGAVIIKEQYGDKPAIAFEKLDDRMLLPTDWTIMIRRSSASHDGWFWAEVYSGMFATKPPPTRYPYAGFGLYCIRCHASAERALSFSSLENIHGYPGEPIVYKVDDFWRWPTPAPFANVVRDPASPQPLAVQTFPAEPLDTFVAIAGHAGHFVSSSQCMVCHSASPGAPVGPTMWVTPAPGSTAPGINVSEYGEWRWSPMGLAGRDPVFFAQLESEFAYLRTLPNHHVGAQLTQEVTDTCMTCHGVMGKRSFAADHPREDFSSSFVFEGDPANPHFAYGGLARDGISCVVCHGAKESKTPPGKNPLAYFLANKINGQFDLGPADRLNGPFKNDTIATHSMSESLGAKPVFSAYVTSARLCASCHTINLPVVDTPPVTAHPQTHAVEQATYLEWLNSSFQNEYGTHPGAKTCQDCHMQAGITDPDRGIALAHIASRIALIQDDTYPQTSHSASTADITVRYREQGFRRHELAGLNVFLLTTFRTYPDVLGVRTQDYMSGSTTDLDDAITNMVNKARTDTARLTVQTHVADGRLVADVDVTNLTGHRFPSGVGFRRACLQLEVRDADAPANTAPLFRSGGTDARGRILGGDGKPLPSESFARGADGKQQYQEHFDRAHPITRPDQVQIFEELVRDDDGNFTTSFIRRDHEVKDNRLLPRGWSKAGPTPTLPAFFLHATYPKGRAASDPTYADGRGHAIVRYSIALPAGTDPTHLRINAQLFYQSWAPYFLAARKAVSGPASERFSQLVDHLDLDTTPLHDWKLRIAAVSATP